MYNAETGKQLLALSQQLLLQAGTTPATLEAADHIVTDLRDVIRYHDWRYYVQSGAVISDQEYDRLFKMLRDIEAHYPSLISPDSPTQRVAHGLTDDFPTVEHNIPMLSLENSYDEEDLLEFDTRLRKLVGNEGISYCVEPKFDGNSIALVYENDQLVRGATRGDGQAGDDITNNIKTMRSIPLSAAFSSLGIVKAEVRGEAIIKNSFFAEMNEERREQGLKTFQNARNTASGALRTKDSAETAKRGLEAFMYQLGYAVDADGNNVLGKHPKLLRHSDCVNELYKLGFKVPDDTTDVFPNIEGVIGYCHQWQENRNSYPYEIDGMVVKLDDLRLQAATGSTSHHPRWAIAFKFKARQAQTKLERIEFQVGRTGAVTPVAKLSPVPLAGVTISSVSLHNEEFIEEKGIMLGDTVVVERAGDVIPYISGVVTSARTGAEQPIIFPRECPSCGSQLVKPAEEAIWRCVNIDCAAQKEERIIHFVSKDAMDVDHLGKDIVKRFIAEGIITHVTDIYQLDYDRIGQLEGWKERSINNLKNGIEATKENPSWRLLVALGIRHVGVVTAKHMARQVESILDYKDWDLERLMGMEDVGPKVAESIHEFFNNQENLQTIHRLNQLGVNINRAASEEVPTDGKLSGKTFLFTGSLSRFTRDEAKDLVEQNGGQLLSGVSKNLNYLVVGADAGSKLEKAQKLGTVGILTEDEFLAMLN